MEVEINGQTIHEGKLMNTATNQLPRQLRGIGKTVEKTWPTPKQLMSHFVAQRLVERQKSAPSLAYEVEQIVVEYEQTSTIAVYKYLETHSTDFASKFLPHDYTGK